MNEEIADIDMIMSTNWYDSRLQHIQKTYQDTVSINPEDIWTPDIKIGNQVLDARYVLVIWQPIP